MSNLKPSILLVICFLLFSCKKNASQDQNKLSKAKPIALNFGIENFNQQERDCEEEIPCLRINLQYPVAQNGKIGVRNAINEYIQQAYMNALIVSEKKDSIDNIKQAANLWIEKFKASLKARPNLTNWEKRSKGIILHQSPKYISIQLPIYSKMGTMPPSVYTYQISFDIDRAFPINVANLILNKKAFQTLCTKEFLAARRRLYPVINPKIEDFFEGKEFQLAKNHAFNQEGLFCYYNAEEIAPYEFGPTYFTIPYKQLKGLIDFKYQQ